MSDADYQIALEHHRAGRLREAGALYQQILSREPAHADALHMLGLLMYQVGQLPRGLALIRRAIELNPTDANYFVDLGVVQAASGQPQEAVIAYREALRLQPNLLQAHNNLGNVLKRLGRLDEAIDALRQAVLLQPKMPEPLSNLANAFKERGDLDEALALLRSAQELNPPPAVAGSLLFLMHFHPGIGPSELLAAHTAWDERYARPLAPANISFPNDRSPERRLRVGYVSPDLRDHPVGWLLLPLLTHHDRDQFEVICYSGARREDAISRRLRENADQWRKTVGQSDEQLAQIIRDDRVDILVDLAMHAEGSRLLTFARKPAPVQVTYLAYASTTGLSAMNYRLTDPYLDPPEEDQWYTEKSVRLPQTYWCYQAPEAAPDVNPLPALSRGHITFGCFNHASKLTRPTLELWARLMSQLPGSRLLLHSPGGSHRQQIRELFARTWLENATRDTAVPAVLEPLGEDRSAKPNSFNYRLASTGGTPVSQFASETVSKQNVDTHRIDFVDRVPLADYFRRYQQIDIALDPFPYTGGTTTCDALWMGVPVVTLAGQTGVSRGGSSILSNVGLERLVARSEEQYIEIATRLAADLKQLSEVRSTLRHQMCRSPLTDSARFTYHLEQAYRNMWRHWCRR